MKSAIATAGCFISRFEAYRAQLAGYETMNILARECLINAVKAQVLKAVVMMDGFKMVTCKQIGEKLLELSGNLEGIFQEKYNEHTVLEQLVVKQEWVDAIEKLTREMENLKLLISKRAAPVKCVSPLTCFNCGKSEHQVRDCDAPADYDGGIRRYEQYVAQKANQKKPSDDETKAMMILAAQHKRVRINDLVQSMDIDQEEPVNNVNTEEAKPNVKKIGKPREISEMIIEKVMDAPVTLTVRELIKIRPATLKTLVNTLTDGKRSDIAALVPLKI
jgi:hypothetical protein